MSFIPGIGIAKGMALTLRRMLEPKATIRYPEVRVDLTPKFRGRLQLLYDEYGTIKCETCFQCAQACPIECIDMGGIDTRGRYHVHWGAPETYGERREESALRRSGRPVPDPAFERFGGIDLAPLDDILDRHDDDPKRLLEILEATQAAYGHLPVAALKHISFRTGAWYAMIYGTASYYGHLRFVAPDAADQRWSCACGATSARPSPCSRGSTARGATPSSPWTATSRTTPPTSPAWSRSCAEAPTRSRAGAASATMTRGDGSPPS
jgi:hypothetical protein